jgi:hypothetical protein
MMGNRLGGPVPLKTTDESGGTHVPVFRTADEATTAARRRNVEEWHLEAVCRMTAVDEAEVPEEIVPDEDEDLNGTFDLIIDAARSAVTRRISQAIERHGEHIVDQLAQIPNHDPWSTVIRDCMK